MAKKKKPHWFKIYGDDIAIFEGQEYEKIGEAFLRALRYFSVENETARRKIADPSDPVSKILYHALRRGVDESLKDYQQSVAAGFKGARKRYGKDYSKADDSEMPFK